MKSSSADDTLSTRLLDAALAYAKRGFCVLPCQSNGKPPLIDEWPARASSSIVDVMLWWDRWPTANVGLLCGPRSNLTVLDIDVKDGKPGLATAERLFGAKLPPSVRTPSGGLHVYLHHVPEWGNRKLGRLGLDVQGDGAYVVAFPSIVDGQPYLLTDCHEATCIERTPRLNGAMAQLLGDGVAARNGNSASDAVPDWSGPEAALPLTFDWTRLPARVQAGLAGDWEHWDGDRTTAVWDIAKQLYRHGLTPTQVLGVLMGHEATYAVATTGNRSGRAGSPSAAAEWFWRYQVVSACRTPFDVLEQAQVRLAGEGEGGEPPPPTQPPASDLLSAGPAAAQEAAGAAVSEYAAARAAAARVLSGDAEAVREVLEAIAQSGLDKVQQDLVLKDLAVSSGVSLPVLRAQLKARITEAMAARREAQLSAGGALQTLVQQYVLVEGQGRCWSMRDQQFVDVQAMRLRYGSELVDMAQETEEGRMRRCGRATYMPLNPWRPSSEGDGQFVRNTETGQWELNLWRAPVLAPSTRSAQRWLDHIEVLGIGHTEREHLLDWLAFTLQYPEAKINHMLLIGGDSGTGKNALIEPLISGLGNYNVEQMRGAQLDGSFDPDLRHTKLLILEELTVGDWRDAQRIYNMLKTYLAAPPNTLSINTKYEKVLVIPNLVNVLALTNDREAMHLEQDDRRVFMVWCRHRRAEQAYFDEYHSWLDQEGGREAVVGFLLRRDVTGFSPTKPPPVTSWKDESLEHSLSPLTEGLRIAWVRGVGAFGWELATVEDLVPTAQQVALELGLSQVVDGRAVRRALRTLKLRSKRVNAGREGAMCDTKVPVYVLRHEGKWVEKTGDAWRGYLENQRFLEGVKFLR